MRAPCLLSPEKRGLQGDLPTTCYCLMGGNTDCPQRCTEREGSTDQSCNMRYYMGIYTGEKTPYFQGGETLKQKSRGLAGLSSLEMLKTILCMALSNLIRWDAGWSAGWTK